MFKTLVIIANTGFRKGLLSRKLGYGKTAALPLPRLSPYGKTAALPIFPYLAFREALPTWKHLFTEPPSSENRRGIKNDIEIDYRRRGHEPTPFSPNPQAPKIRAFIKSKEKPVFSAGQIKTNYTQGGTGVLNFTQRLRCLVKFLA